MINLLANLVGVVVVTFLGLLFIFIGLLSIKTKKFQWGRTYFPFVNKYPTLKTDKKLHVNIKGGQATLHGVLFLIFGLLLFVLGFYTIIYSVLSYLGIKI